MTRRILVTAALYMAAMLVLSWWLTTRAPRPIRPAAIPLDTVPCGHLKTCTPLVRVRYMSDNPFKQGE